MNKLISAISKLISAIGRARREGLGEDGIAAVSFAIIAPMLLLISFATLEFSMYMFEQGRTTEAARRGARVAAIATAIANLETLGAAPVDCTSGGGAVSCTGGAIESAATFDAVVATMQAIKPDIGAQNVRVLYRESNIGTTESGGIKAFVTVSLVNLTHDFTMLAAIPGMPATVGMPDYSTTQMANAYLPP